MKTQINYLNIHFLFFLQGLLIVFMFVSCAIGEDKDREEHTLLTIASLDDYINIDNNFLNESYKALEEGKFTSQIRITIEQNGLTFKNLNPTIISSSIQVLNLPTGLGASFEKENANTLVLELTNTATVHDISQSTTLTVNLKKELFFYQTSIVSGITDSEARIDISLNFSPHSLTFLSKKDDTDIPSLKKPNKIETGRANDRDVVFVGGESTGGKGNIYFFELSDPSTLVHLETKEETTANSKVESLQLYEASGNSFLFYSGTNLNIRRRRVNPTSLDSIDEYTSFSANINTISILISRVGHLIFGGETGESKLFMSSISSQHKVNASPVSRTDDATLGLESVRYVEPFEMASLTMVCTLGEQNSFDVFNVPYKTSLEHIANFPTGLPNVTGLAVANRNGGQYVFVSFYNDFDRESGIKMYELSIPPNEGVASLNIRKVDFDNEDNLLDSNSEVIFVFDYREQLYIVTTSSDKNQLILSLLDSDEEGNFFINRLHTLNATASNGLGDVTDIQGTLINNRYTIIVTSESENAVSLFGLE